jgi:hypothetical protein
MSIIYMQAEAGYAGNGAGAQDRSTLSKKAP